MENKTIVLEPSTNSHILQGEAQVTTNLPDLGGMVIAVADKGVVLHGEHGVICTEEKNVIKLVQQEQNPITKSLQNSFD